jgi:TldD protein
MNFSRRNFLKATSLACGAATLPVFSWEAEAAEAAAVDKHGLADIAIRHAKTLGASYADIRINRYRRESIFTREQRVQNVSRTTDFGFGVRVLFKGAWGFAASPLMTSESVKRITEQAIDTIRNRHLEKLVRKRSLRSPHREKSRIPALIERSGPES